MSFHKNEYIEKGYTHFKSFFNHQVISELKEECEQILAKYQDIDCDPIQFSRVQTNEGFSIYRIDPIQGLSPKLRSILTSDRLKGMFLELFDQEVNLLKDKIIYKPPGARGFPLHQDYSWSKGRFPLSLFTVIIPLELANAENGAVEFFPNYHHDLISDPSEARHFNEREISMISLDRGEILELNPGDVVVFSGLVPHQSQKNESSNSRMQIFLSYNLAKDGDHYEDFLNHFRKYSKERRNSLGEYVAKK